MNTVLRKRRLPSWIKKHHSQKYKISFPLCEGRKKLLYGSYWICPVCFRRVGNRTSPYPSGNKDLRHSIRILEHRPKYPALGHHLQSLGRHWVFTGPKATPHPKKAFICPRNFLAFVFCFYFCRYHYGYVGRL